MKRLVMCTSTGCIEYGPERYRNLGIDILRIHLFFKEKEYLEGYDLDPQELYRQMLDTKDMKDNLPHTAMPTYEEIKEHFEKAIADGYEEIICICISSGLGGTWNFVRLVAKDFEDRIKIHVIDAKTTCFGEGYMAIKAKELVDKGVDTETILKEIEWLKNNEAFIGLDERLDYLIYNGRLKGFSAFFGKALSVVPVLHFDKEGSLTALFKGLGLRKALDKTCEYLKENIIKDRDHKDYLLLHVFTGEGTVAKMREVEKEHGIVTNHEDVIMSPVSGIHNGPWLAGYIYIPLRREDEPLE